MIKRIRALVCVAMAIGCAKQQGAVSDTYSATASANVPAGVKASANPRPPSTTRAQSIPCGGVRVSVMVSNVSLDAQQPGLPETKLRALASNLIESSRRQLASDRIEVSPAIRTFRVTAVDRASAEAIIGKLRTQREVESAEIDECNATSR